MWKNEHHTEHNQKVNINCSISKCQTRTRDVFNGTFDFFLFPSHSVSLPLLSHFAHFHLHFRLHRSAYSEIVEYLFHGIYYLAVYITCSRSCARAHFRPCCMMLFFSLLLPVHSLCALLGYSKFG